MYPLSHLMILDIETVSSQRSFHELTPAWQELWVEKYSKTALAELSPAESYSQRAAISAEFGKIICISAGYFYSGTDSKLTLRLKTLSGHDEKDLLTGFIHLCNQFSQKQNPFYFSGHNIKEFDIPYLGRRMMHHGIALPGYFQLQGKKPWETQMYDTMEFWKFGDYKNYTSLKLLCSVLDVPTSKEGIDGSMVGKVYYEEDDLARIAAYCEKDVIAVAQLLLRFKNLPLLNTGNIFAD